MKIIIGLVLYIFVALYASAAGFDCDKAITKVEKSICSQPHLSELDDRLMDVYRQSMAQGDNSETLKLEQRAWLTNVRNKCIDNACLESVYIERIKRLENVDDVPPNEETKIAETSLQKDEAQASNEPVIKTTPKNEGDTKQVIATDSIDSNKKNEKTKSQSGSITENDEINIIVKILSFIFPLLLALFVIGMVKPKWILRWDSSANRKKVAVYFSIIVVAIGLITSLMGAGQLFVNLLDNVLVFLVIVSIPLGLIYLVFKGGGSFFSSLFDRIGPQKCPSCGSENIVTVNKTLIDTRQTETSQTKTFWTLKQCRICGNKWERNEDQYRVLYNRK